VTFNFPTGGVGSEASERRRGGVLLPTIGVLAALLVSFVLFTGFYTDWLWFTSVDKPQVYTIAIVTRGILFAVFGLSRLSSCWPCSSLIEHGQLSPAPRPSRPPWSATAKPSSRTAVVSPWH
jgi:hypothetical protein